MNRQIFVLIQNFILLAALGCLSTAATANIRRPLQRMVPAGRHVSVIGNSILVDHEEIKVQCDRNHCRTQAIYNVINTGNTTLEMDPVFVAPVQGEIQTVCGQHPRQVSQLLPSAKPEATDLPALQDDYMFSTVPLSTAAFHCVLRPGPATISIEYSQLVRLEEHDVSYFSKSWFRRFYDYELSPLKEWKLAESFHLTFDLEIPKAPVGFFASLFGADPEVHCKENHKDFRIETTRKAKDNIAFVYKWQKDFPDRLECSYIIE